MNDILDYSHSSDCDTHPTTHIARLWTVTFGPVNTTLTRANTKVYTVDAPIASKACLAAWVLAEADGITRDIHSIRSVFPVEKSW
jgi:hypothetical protein